MPDTNVMTEMHTNMMVATLIVRFLMVGTVMAAPRLLATIATRFAVMEETISLLMVLVPATMVILIQEMDVPLAVALNLDMNAKEVAMIAQTSVTKLAVMASECLPISIAMTVMLKMETVAQVAVLSKMDFNVVEVQLLVLTLVTKNVEMA